jgi:hypothetical protein
MSKGAKLLFLDIETAPILMTSWSMRSPEASAVWVERDTFILMFSYKWAHEKTVKTCCLPDFPRYKRHKHDDKDFAAYFIACWTMRILFAHIMAMRSTSRK